MSDDDKTVSQSVDVKNKNALAPFEDLEAPYPAVFRH